MSSFLFKKRTKEEYFKKISGEPFATRKNREMTISNFEKFVSKRYEKRNSDEIFEELSVLQGLERENALYDMLQDWINWNQKEGRTNSTVRAMFSNLRQYLYFKGIKTDPQDIKANLKFGKKVDDERHPLSDEEYRSIVNAFSKSPVRQSLYLYLGSSGSRIGETLKLRKRDLDFSQQRIKVSIPASITKTRKGRTTYMSKETEAKLKPILDRLNPDDLIFTKEYANPSSAVIVEQKSLIKVLDRLVLNSRYSSNNFRKITSHSFRSYFFTKAARKHGENYAHKMTGHGGYLMQYDRLTEEEKLKMYLELEPDLMIFDQTRNELEISRLREENQSIKELRDEVKKLRESQAKQDEKTIEEMKRKGILPN